MNLWFKLNPATLAALLATLAVAGLALLALKPASAHALGYGSAGAFDINHADGQIAMGVGVNDTSGDVYVAPLSNSFGPAGLQRFEADGTPISTFPADALWAGLAVDNSDGANDGDVYGLNTDFLGGGAAASINNYSFDGTAGPTFGVSMGAQQAPGITVDGDGNIYYANLNQDRVQKFAPGGGVPLLEITGLTDPTDVAVDSDGNIYVADGANGGQVQKFDSAGANPVTVADNIEAKSVAVNTSTDDVFVGAGDPTSNDGANNSDYQVIVYDSAGEELTSFGEGTFATVAFPFLIPFVAVNSDDGTVYVSSPGGGGGDGAVEIFTPIAPPDATTNPASDVTKTAATLNGTVNANGNPADCEFQYVDDAEFQANAWANATVEPCDVDPVPGATDIEVEVDVSGLAQGTLYHSRVVATNPGGTTNGGDEQFTTLADPPAATTNAATAISGNGAQLNATVNANGDPADCLFQYTTKADHTANGFANADEQACSEDPVTGDTDKAVSAAVGGLANNTTYVFRVQATNLGGTTNGDPAELTTLAAPPNVSTNPGSNVGDSTATLNATVDANGNAAACELQLTTQADHAANGFANAEKLACSPNPVGGDGATAVSANATGLAAKTSYVYRVVATNNGGSSAGAAEQFTTTNQAARQACINQANAAFEQELAGADALDAQANRQARKAKKAERQQRKAKKKTKKLSKKTKKLKKKTRKLKKKAKKASGKKAKRAKKKQKRAKKKQKSTKKKAKRAKKKQRKAKKKQRRAQKKANQLAGQAEQLRTDAEAELAAALAACQALAR